MHVATEGRRSIAVHGPRPDIQEQDLRQHSYDLILFPRYLQRLAVPRVRVEMSSQPRGKTPQMGPDLMALYAGQGQEQRQFAYLRPDDQGVLVDSDAFYEVVHAAFDARAQQAGGRYVGFARYGTPPFAPLFALALLYRQFGRGLYLAGAMLPTPWPSLTVAYQLQA